MMDIPPTGDLARRSINIITCAGSLACESIRIPPPSVNQLIHDVIDGIDHLVDGGVLPPEFQGMGSSYDRLVWLLLLLIVVVIVSSAA